MRFLLQATLCFVVATSATAQRGGGFGGGGATGGGFGGGVSTGAGPAGRSGGGFAGSRTTLSGSVGGVTFGGGNWNSFLHPTDAPGFVFRGGAENSAGWGGWGFGPGIFLGTPGNFSGSIGGVTLGGGNWNSFLHPVDRPGFVFRGGESTTASTSSSLYWPYAFYYPGFGYGSAGYEPYQSTPNVVVMYPAPAAQVASARVERAHPITREYDQNGQEIRPAAPAAASASPTYLIAFTDHNIRGAVAYSVEGKTLHYVTLEHEEKQAPLDTVDRALSLQLNRERQVPFQLPAQ